MDSIPDTIDTISFDCYGTLIDWETGLLIPLRHLNLRFGTSCSDARLLELYAQAESRHETGIFKPYRVVLVEVLKDIAAACGWTLDLDDRYLLADAVARWRPFPDTVDALHRLKARYRLVILSNVDREMFASTRKRLETDFDAVYLSQDIGSYKPDIRNFRYLRASLQIKDGQLLHAAQSRHHDIGPAKEMGWPAAWINRPSVCSNVGVTVPSDAEPDVTFPSLKAFADWALATTLQGSVLNGTKLR